MRNEGQLRSRMVSIIATQMGVAAMIKAAKPELARCSAQITKPLPPTQSSNPDSINVLHSWRVGRIRCLDNRLQITRITPAIETRKAPNVKGGKPHPSRTA